MQQPQDLINFIYKLLDTVDVFIVKRVSEVVQYGYLFNHHIMANLSGYHSVVFVQKDLDPISQHGKIVTRSLTI